MKNPFLYAAVSSAWQSHARLVVMGLLILISLPAAAQEKPADSAAENAWQELLKESQPPPVPESWRATRPSEEEIRKFQEQRSARAAQAADQAQAFYTRHPDDPRAKEARQKQWELLGFAVQLGHTNRLAELETVEAQVLKDPSLDDEQRFRIRGTAVHRNAMSRQAEGMKAVLEQFEKGVRALQKDFPQRAEVDEMLLEIASDTEGEKARSIAQEVASRARSDELKEAAQALLKKFDLIGKPLPIQFTAVDGREVDLQKMKGKVVLIDFWATWCGPCIAELPKVKAAYESLHPRGFEIVGISFDQSQEKLANFVAQEKVTWPQYFDGKGWGNKWGTEYGINSIPVMWLLDKKGVVRDLNGRENLVDKVEKLLAERP